MNCNTNLRPNPLKMMMRDIKRTEVAFEICKRLKNSFDYYQEILMMMI